MKKLLSFTVLLSFIILASCGGDTTESTVTTDVTGTWSGTDIRIEIGGANSDAFQMTYVLTQSEGTVSGTQTVWWDGEESVSISSGTVSESAFAYTTTPTQNESDDCHLYPKTWTHTVSGTTMTLTSVSGKMCDGDGQGGHTSLTEITGGSGTLTKQ